MTYSERDYWSARYASGLSSGAGSEGFEADWKRLEICKILNRENIKSVVDLGCGDCQLMFPILSDFNELDYLGVDLAPSIIGQHQQRRFKRDGDTAFLNAALSDGAIQADLVLMIDVLFHASSQEAHDAALTTFFRSIKKVGIFTCWNDKIKDVKLSNHCFYRPVILSEKFNITKLAVPGVDVKDFVIVRPKSV